jgi:murein DD-endopeptidase MepM/ murein hydrolase activator NlpD
MTFDYQLLRMAAQRLNIVSHPKTAVKKLSLAALLLVVFLILGSVTGISAAAGKIADKFILYVHVARLYTKEPDQTIAMPIQDVSKKQIADTWHAPRGNDRLHEGQDIFAPQGTPVLSATEGYIVNIGENNLGGQTVSVVGAGGRTYYYAHLDSYAPHIAEGDYVTKQTVLGYVGTTGNASGTPPHLHFGVYAPGGAMNPLPLLSDRNPSAKKPSMSKPRR